MSRASAAPDRRPVESEPSGASAHLRVNGITVRFGGLTALADVSFEVRPGEIVSVIGPNGAGKSTLLNTISGLTRGNAAGSVEVDKQEILGMPPASIASIGIGRSFQNPPLLDGESVLENLMMGTYLRFRFRMIDQVVRTRYVRRLEQQAEQEATEVLERVGLAARAHELAAALPYGSRKLLDIARVLVARPRLLLLDEPTSGLDGDEQHAMAAVLEQVHDTLGVSVLIVEHHMDIVRRLSQRVVGLEAGSVVMSGATSEVLDSEQFRKSLTGATAAAEREPSRG
jgi:branched-chain amino acid transport system ATP-binding protein